MQIKPILTIVILFTSIGMAQQPAASPCSAAEYKASQAESRAEAERLKVETASARNDALERTLAALKKQTQEAEGQLGAERQNVVRLVASNESAQVKVANLERELAEARRTNSTLKSERDAARLTIKRANGRWICEAFHLGCVEVK